jgi:CBS domain-containing protein
MKVQELMTKGVEACSRDANLATAAMIMWRMDCGAVPVVNDRHPVGMITDRDICVAVATKHRRAEDIRVGEVISGTVHHVRSDDDVRVAVDTMRSERVRRLPVVDKDGLLVGIVSLSDVVRAAGKATARSKPLISAEDVLLLVKSISEPDGGLEVARRKEAFTARA